MQQTETVESVTGATLEVEKCDWTGDRLTLINGPHAGQEIEVIGITPFRFASLAVRFKGRNIAINPTWLVDVTDLVSMEQQKEDLSL